MAAVKIQDKNCLQSTLRKKKINTLFAGLGRSVLGKTVPSVLSSARGRQITYIYVTNRIISFFLHGRKRKVVAADYIVTDYFNKQEVSVLQGTVLASSLFAIMPG